MTTPPVIGQDDTVEAAIRVLLETDLPAIPVVDAEARYVGIFGEREFMGAIFPGYLKELRHAAFVPRSLDEALEKREESRHDPVRRYMNTEHVEVAPVHADVQLAEIFLHHRVLIVPIVDNGRVAGIITREDYTKALARRILTP